MKVQLIEQENDCIAYTSCVCDGTYGFLADMYYGLTKIGCDGIETNIEEIEFDKDRRWMSTLFEAWGHLPKDVAMKLIEDERRKNEIHRKNGIVETRNGDYRKGISGRGRHYRDV